MQAENVGSPCRVSTTSSSDWLMEDKAESIPLLSKFTVLKRIQPAFKFISQLIRLHS